MENFYKEQNRHMPDFKILADLPNVQLNKEEAILSLIVVLGSSISLVGLIFAFITYSLFSDQRSLSGTLIMNLLATLFMTQLMYVIGVGGTEDPDLCASLAFALQYFNLAEFCWISSLTFNMHQSFVRNFHTSSIRSPGIISSFIKYSLFGWATPILFLIFGFFLHRKFHTAYAQESFRFDYLNCWFLNEKIYIYSFVIPVTILLVVITQKLYKSWRIVRHSVVQLDQRLAERMRQTRYSRYNLYVKLTLILTTTYINGVVARLSRNHISRVTFNILLSLQGLLVAIAVTCNYQTFQVYAKSIRRRRDSDSEEPLVGGSPSLLQPDQPEDCDRLDLPRSASWHSIAWKHEMLSV